MDGAWREVAAKRQQPVLTVGPGPGAQLDGSPRPRPASKITDTAETRSDKEHDPRPRSSKQPASKMEKPDADERNDRLGTSGLGTDFSELPALASESESELDIRRAGPFGSISTE